MNNINYAFYKHLFTPLLIGYREEKLVSLRFVEDDNVTSIKTSFSDFVYNRINQYFMLERRSFDIPLLINATEFQTKVYKALLNIPYGHTKSYKEIAQEIGNPKAYRAVGNANNKNPIPLIIPCHRVIGSNHSLTGYAYGLDMKKRLLELESSNISI